MSQMKTALVISSYVSASKVGATASAFCLRRLGIDTTILPTTLFGRHPGWGEPGGTKTDPALLRSIWDGIKAQNIVFDAILTGYMADTAHVSLSAEIIDAVRALNPNTMIMVDPVMGDQGRLYIAEDIAHAIRADLLPRADMLTPNLFELSYLTGQNPRTLDAIIKTASTYLLCPSIITSVPDEDNIGTLYIGSDKCWLTSHEKFDRVPNGGGDSFAATVLAHLLNGHDIDHALAQSTASIFAILQAAVSDDHGELPLVRLQDALINTPPLRLKRL